MNDTTPDPRLQRLLGGPELATVRRQLRRRFERADANTPLETVRLTGLEPVAYRALCQLTGRPVRSAQSMTLDLTALDAQLQKAGLAHSLRDALTRLEGPIVPHAQIKRARQARWEALMARGDRGVLLAAWIRSPTAPPLLKRLGRTPEQATPLLAATDKVLQRLPAGGLARSQLAAETLGDAHGLDDGRPVATLVLTAWRHHETTRLPTPDDRAAEDRTAQDTGSDERQRDTWARAGVLVNELARPVLFLNLPHPPDAPRTWVAGEPGYLSLRQLVRQPPSWPVSGRALFVCENPNIVAIAADHLGIHCAPLICTEGMPAAAQRTLLDQLAAAGARLHYHGDYDWSGLVIGNHVMRTWDATPWRFGEDDYLSAVAQAPARPRDMKPSDIEAVWDPGLASAMREHGLAVAEEAVVAVLLEALARR